MLSINCKALNLSGIVTKPRAIDLAKLFSNRVLEVTAQVLSQHIQSEAEISHILAEIRSEASL